MQRARWTEICQTRSLLRSPLDGKKKLWYYRLASVSYTHLIAFEWDVFLKVKVSLCPNTVDLLHILLLDPSPQLALSRSCLLYTSRCV